jgi:acyl-CoA synthetase (AMP-forming)/AMP-acid ligase II
MEILQQAPMYRDAIAGSRFRFLRCGSGQLRDADIDAIEQTFRAPFLAGLTSTEACAITHDPLPPGRRKRGSVGVPSCSQVTIINEAQQICPSGKVGEVVVRGPLVFEGYLDDDQATAEAFVNGWFRTGDLGRFDEDGYLYLVGRIKDLINRGGEKISPLEIDAVIEAMPGVLVAATFAIPHQSLGEEIAAAIVTDGRAAINAPEIIGRVRRCLGPKRVPRKIYFVDQLPRTDSGKVRRSELPRLLGLERAEAPASSESSAVAAAASLSPLEAALMGLWSSVLQVSSFDVNEDFFLLGGDSLRGARLLVNVKAVFGVELAIRTLFGNAATVAGMAREIEAARLANANAPHA